MSVVSIAVGIRRLGRLATIAGVAMLAACSAPATDDGHEASGALRGELVITAVHGKTEADGRIEHTLRVDGSNDRVHLRFDTVPDDLQPRAHLRVWGRREGARFDVTHYEQVPGNEGSLSSPLLSATPVSPSIATVLVDINQTGVTKTKADLTRVFASRSNTGPLFSDKAPGLSMAQYYDAMSYGAVRTTMDFFGPFPWSGNPCLDGDYEGLADAMRAKVGGDYDHYVFYYGAEQNCDAGWGSQGTAAEHLSDIWLNDITFASGPAEELGHNFGWPHTSSLKCAGMPMADDLSKCTTDEYGDAYAVMGGGDNDAPAFEKWYARYLSGCNAVRVRSSGTYTLLPIEKACNGIQALQIPMAKTTRTFTTPQGGNKKNPAKHFYLELREKIGMDSDMVPGVYVHVSDEVTVPDRTCARSIILDMNPATKTQDGLTLGQKYVEPGGGVSFTIDALDAEHASVTVTLPTDLGPSTCDDGTQLELPGPPASSCSGVVVVAPDGGTAVLDSGSTVDGASGPRDGAVVGDAAAPVNDARPEAHAAEPDATDARAVEPDAAEPPDAAGTSIDAAATRPAASAGEIAGECGCRMGARSPSAGPSAVVLGGLALLTRRRRRRTVG